MYGRSDLDDTLCDYKGAQELSKNAINCYLKCRNKNIYFLGNRIFKT